MLLILAKPVESLVKNRGFGLLLPIIQLTAIAWIPALLIALAVSHIHPGPSSSALFSSPFRAIAGGIIIAPIVETYAMRLGFRLLGKFIPDERWLILSSAIIWSTLHYQSEAWGLHALWPFFVFGVCFIHLRRQSMDRAIWVTATIHALCNALFYGVHLLSDGGA